MSFKGQNKKKSFYKLKIWEVIQGNNYDIFSILNLSIMQLFDYLIP